MNSLKLASAFPSALNVLATLVLGVAAWAPPAAAQVTITGTTTQLTTSRFDQMGPSISGNLVCYTDYTKGPTEGQVYCHDISQNTDFQLTTSNVITYQVASDVSGSTVVYTEFTGGAPTAKYCTISYATNPPSCSPAAAPLSGASGGSYYPSIDGSLAAWTDGSSGAAQVFAVDLSVAGSVAKQLTQNPANNNSLGVNVSGRNIVYFTSLDAANTRCQIFLTNFDTMQTTQITNTPTGCNSYPDINGQFVVYQSTRNAPPVCATSPVTAAFTNCSQIFVYDLSANKEIAIPTAGLGYFQRAPHVSGDWVSFDDVAFVSSTNLSSIRLYQISTGQVFTAVQATTNLDSAFLNDIDGYNVVYTSAARGNYDIYLFQFTPSIPLTIAANSFSRTYGASDQPLTVTYTSNGSVIAPDPTKFSGTLTCTSADTSLSPVGTYPINCSGLASTFYTINFVPGSVTVTQAPLVVSASSASRPYGANNPPFLVTLSGLQNGDTYSTIYSTVATPQSPVGTYPVVPSVAQSSTSIQNYSITVVNGTLTVFQEPTSLVVTLAPTSIMVGLSSVATVTLNAPDMVIPIDPSVLSPFTMTSPVASDILTNGGMCTPVPSTSPGLASCTIGITSVEPNGRTLNAGFLGTPDLGPSSGTADLIVTASLLSQQSCIASDFRNVAVPGGSTIWFNSIFRVRDVTKQIINISFFQSSVQFQYTDPSGQVITVNQSMPDAHIVIDPTATSASTNFDALNNVWLTTIPFDLDDNAFLTGLPWLVPSAGLPADVEPVRWCGTFASDVADIDIGWRWAAAAYSSFGNDNTTLGVKPMDTDFDNPGSNRDRAGTPENYKQFVIPGARGKSAKNYTGSYSRSLTIE